MKDIQRQAEVAQVADRIQAEPGAAINDAEWMLPQLIANRASSCPDEPLLQHVSGREITYQRFHELNLSWASAYRRVGVQPGEVVMTMLPVSADAHHAWLGLAWLNAIEAPINHDYRGHLLIHAIELTGARVIIAAAAFAQRIADIADQIDRELVLVVPDSDGMSLDGVTVWDRTAFFGQLEDLQIVETPAPHDIACLLFTSGTTGPSKSVRVPWKQLYCTATCPPNDALARGEGFYSTWPPYHASGKSALYLPVVKAGRLVARDRFSVTEFWSDVRASNSTFALLGGPLVHFLVSQPRTPEDYNNPLRGIWSSPLSQTTLEFANRFNVKIATAFGMTEIGTPISSGGWVTDNLDSCGKVRPGYEIRIVDEHDGEVPKGEVGELVVRTSEPWTLNDGYHGMPEQTATAWRNGWFHTGDAFRIDEEDRLYFVDRLKDCIRRRGENISSFDLERYVMDHPDVAECAAIGVPSEYGEEDIKICVVLKPGVELTPEDLHRYLVERSPRFMVPRYIQIMQNLPKTEATLRIQKHILRSMHGTEDTWDRDANE